jgi:hypothetical protein
MALWALKSFYYHAPVDWPLVLHDGGGFTPAIRAALLHHFPNVRILDWDQATKAVEESLAQQNLSAIARARKSSALLRKLIDCKVLGCTQNVLLLDSDVLFFQTPLEVIEAGESNLNRFLFNRDYLSSYSIGPEQSRAGLGLELPDCINSGLGVFPTGLIDLKFIEEICASGQVLLNSFTEQTLFALLAARSGFEYLSDRYAVLTGPVDIAAMGLVSRHYVSPVRNLFFDEGIPHLKKVTKMLQNRAQCSTSMRTIASFPAPEAAREQGKF